VVLDIVFIGTGLALIVWSTWGLPRQMSRLRDRVGSDERRNRLAAALRSPLYRLAWRGSTLLGVLLIVLGTIFLITGAWSGAMRQRRSIDSATALSICCLRRWFQMAE